MTKLYHRDVYLPERIRNLTPRRIPVFASAHARRAALDDRYGVIQLPEDITFSGANVIEIEMQGSTVTKWVLRLPLDKFDDAIYVVTHEGCIKTVWRNRKTDQHATLNVHIYSRA